MASKPTVWPFEGTKIAVLADCHIHPGGGPAFPPILFDLLDAEDPDLIVTLGDMGEASGLDELSEYAPVIGVRGQDDSDDPRTDNELLVLTSERLVVGCVFDAVGAGLAVSSDPFEPVPEFRSALEGVFGRRVDLLLCASTHRSAAAVADGVSVADPGSAVLPADGSSPSFVEVTLNGGFKVAVKTLD